MEIRVPRGSAAKSGKTKAPPARRKPPSRIQKHAPASLQLDDLANASAAPAWEQSIVDGGAASAHHAPIPLLSPLVVPPSPLCDAEVDEAALSDQQSEESTSPVSSPAEGWRHPASPIAMAEPASLAPLFQVQCALVRKVQ